MPGEHKDSGWDPKAMAGAMRLLVLTSQIGLTVASPIVVGAVIGSYVDAWLGSKGIATVVLILLGVVAGAYSVYKLVMKEVQ